jgi:hypothetical protein
MKTQFFGYQSEFAASQSLGAYFPQIKSRATKRAITVCSEGHGGCVAGFPLGGFFFRYADGTKDNGRRIYQYRAEINGLVYCWG